MHHTGFMAPVGHLCYVSEWMWVDAHLCVCVCVCVCTMQGVSWPLEAGWKLVSFSFCTLKRNFSNILYFYNFWSHRIIYLWHDLAVSPFSNKIQTYLWLYSMHSTDSAPPKSSRVMASVKRHWQHRGEWRAIEEFYICGEERAKGLIADIIKTMTLSRKVSVR